MIRFENVSKEFDSEGISVAAVKDVSLEINKTDIPNLHRRSQPADGAGV